MGDNDASSSNAAAAAAGNDGSTEVGAAIGKIEESRDGTPSSIESTPEQEAGAETTNEPAQPQKRKGGRKPIYATSEERKQRNRQAQAAFRERRTEYIKQLEATIKQNEETLSTLQQSHRSAADECLMLRYKNSLLERILLEKGIDVQAELSMKTGSPTFPPGFMQHIPIQPTQPPLQRAAVQRHHARRSGQAITPKLQPGQSQPDLTFHNTSPQAVPTPSSHVSSPNTVSTRSPVTMHQGGMTPPTSAVLAQTQAQQYQQGFSRSQQPSLNPQFYQPAQHQSQHFQRAQRPPPPQQFHSNTSGISSQSPSSQSNGGHTGPPGSSGSGGGSNSTSAVPSASAYYPSPFQKHIDQLEQEYDTQAASHSMLDQSEPGDDDPSDPDNNIDQGGHPHGLQGAYPPQQMQFDQAPPPTQQPTPGSGFAQFGQQHAASGMPPPGQQQMSPHYNQPHQMQQGHHPSQVTEHDSGAYASIPHMIDPNDPMLDADPFGLSASMHYPTSYSFDQHQQGR